VETLCSAAPIIDRGADWFKSMGTEQSTGPKIVSVSGDVQRPGNYEIELGITGRELVYDLAGGPPDGRKVKCWFPGGSSAPVLLEEHLDLPYTFEDMAEAGSMLGSGAIIVVDEDQPLVPLALRLAEFYRHESCGKCVPCREGTNWTVKMLERIDDGEATPMDLEIMAQVQENIIGHCLCVLGDSMAMPIGSMIKHFREEFEQHIAEARERRQLEETAAFSAGELAASVEAGAA
jgi:NADH-quinone oxidoreductase subunit F